MKTNNMYVTEWSEHQAWITTVYSHENCISPFQRLHVLFLSLKSLVVSQHLQWEPSLNRLMQTHLIKMVVVTLLVEKDTSLKRLRIFGIWWLAPGAGIKYIFPYYKYIKYYVVICTHCRVLTQIN